ncbi:MAG: hypothetical protein SFV51_04935 [Bryobacteraceae bacterium]|nr:hypothetical protein [Bryobacteraceae bacterium]
MTKFALIFTLMTVPALTAAESFQVTLYQPTIVAGKQLKPGSYKVTLKEGAAMLSDGKQSVEAPVRVEATESKNIRTSVRFLNGDGTYKIDEIRIGKSSKKLVFENSTQAGS